MVRLKKAVDKSVFYSYNHICSYDAMWHAICGGRGIGKTYGAKKRAISDWIKNGNEFIYLRRYSTELAESIPTFFQDIERANEFPDWDFRTNGRFAEASPASERKLERRNWRTIGRFIALSQAQQMKSVNFAFTHTIIFDEFIIEKGMVQYLPNEAIVLLNFYSTVDRNEDRVKIFMLSNAVSIANPYFLHWSIDPDETNRNGVVRVNDSLGNIYFVVHFPESHAYQGYVASSRFGQFIAGSEYADYAVSNQFKDNHKLLIESKPSDARYNWTIETAKGTFSVWTDRVGLYYIQSKRPKDENIFTMLVENMSEEKTRITISGRMLTHLRGSFNSGKVRFDNPRSRNAFAEIFRR